MPLTEQQLLERFPELKPIVIEMRNQCRELGEKLLKAKLGDKQMIRGVHIDCDSKKIHFFWNTEARF